MHVDMAMPFMRGCMEARKEASKNLMKEEARISGCHGERGDCVIMFITTIAQSLYISGLA